MASGLAERKKPEHIHNPSGPRAFLLRPRYKEPSGSAGPGSGHAQGRVAVRTGLPLGRERTGPVRSRASGSVTFIGAIGSLAPAPPASKMRASF